MSYLNGQVEQTRECSSIELIIQLQTRTVRLIVQTFAYSMKKNLISYYKPLIFTVFQLKKKVFRHSLFKTAVTKIRHAFIR